MGQYSGPKKKLSSSTLLATQEKKQESLNEETLLVTETFHLSSKKEGVFYRLTAWNQDRRSLFLISSVCVFIFFSLVIFFWHSQKIDTVVNIVNRPNEAQKFVVSHPQTENVHRAIVAVKDKNVVKEPVSKVTFAARGPGKMENDPNTSSSRQTLIKSNPTTEEKNKVSSRKTTVQTFPYSATGAAFSNGFSYGMQHGVRLASPGAAEANLRASKFRNNASFSNGTRRDTRQRGSNNSQLRFTIKDSGTRSVK